MPKDFDPSIFNDAAEGTMTQEAIKIFQTRASEIGIRLG